MDDLVQFLRARLDEDEAGARQAAPGPWATDWDQPDYVRDGSGYVALSGYGKRQIENQNHASRHNPARVLAEVDAKRRMLDNYEMGIHAAKTLPRPHDDMLAVFETSAAAWRTALRLLALSYGAHQEYREEWRL